MPVLVAPSVYREVTGLIRPGIEPTRLEFHNLIKREVEAELIRRFRIGVVIRPEVVSGLVPTGDISHSCEPHNPAPDGRAEGGEF